jgi:hypothetical protein
MYVESNVYKIKYTQAAVLGGGDAAGSIKLWLMRNAAKPFALFRHEKH